MTRARREASDVETRPPSNARCFLAAGMGLGLLMAALGLFWEHYAVFAAGLGIFGLICLQVVLAHCVSRITVRNAVADRPLSHETL